MKPDHEKMIERIYSEIVGDEYTEGLIPKVNRNTQKLEKHEIYFRVVFGLFTLISGLVIFLDTIKTFFK
jgi:hypothetical protein